MEDASSEIEALRCIFEDELEVEDNSGSARPHMIVGRKVRPLEAADRASASVRLEIEMDQGYPDASPVVRVREPRGLAEGAVDRLEKDIGERLEQMQGMPVLYEIIQMCVAFVESEESTSAVALTCPICLMPLGDAAVSATLCEHYAHSACLQAHTDHSRRQLGEKLHSTPRNMRAEVDTCLYCPVCRHVMEEELEPIEYVDPKEQAEKAKKGGRRSSGKAATRAAPCVAVKEQQGLADFSFDWKAWRAEQKKMKEVYERQQRQGGIIDLDEERKRNLITEETVVVLDTLPEGVVLAPPTETPPIVVPIAPPPGFEGVCVGMRSGEETKAQAQKKKQGRRHGEREQRRENGEGHQKANGKEDANVGSGSERGRGGGHWRGRGGHRGRGGGGGGGAGAAPSGVRAEKEQKERRGRGRGRGPSNEAAPPKQ